MRYFINNTNGNHDNRFIRCLKYWGLCPHKKVTIYIYNKKADSGLIKINGHYHHDEITNIRRFGTITLAYTIALVKDCGDTTKNNLIKALRIIINKCYGGSKS